MAGSRICFCSTNSFLSSREHALNQPFNSTPAPQKARRVFMDLGARMERPAKLSRVCCGEGRALFANRLPGRGAFPLEPLYFVLFCSANRVVFPVSSVNHLLALWICSLRRVDNGVVPVWEKVCPFSSAVLQRPMTQWIESSKDGVHWLLLS